MSTGTLSIDNVKDVPYVTTVDSSGFVGNKVLSLKSNVLFQSNIGAGDGHTVEQANSDVNTNKEVEEAAYLQNESTDAERFESVLEKRRMGIKAEEDRYEWKSSPQSNNETVSARIDNLIGKLRRRFSEEKQARVDTIKPSYSQHIFSNSVDAFLRYHEKPKIDIHYSEAGGDSQGEGLYSFAVRPSRIRKRRRDTSYIPQENANVCAAPPNAFIGAGLGNSDDYSGGNSTRASNTVSAIQNADASVDVLLHKNTLIWQTPSVYKASDITVSLISKCTTSENVNSHMIYPNDNIETCDTADSCVVPLTNKMMGFAEMLPIIEAIVTPPNPYFSPIIPIHKVRFCMKTYGRAIPLISGNHSSDRSIGVVELPSQTLTISSDISAMSKYHSLDRNDSHVTPAFQKVTFGRAIHSMFEYNSLDKNVDHVTSPFQRVTLKAEINGALHTIDMLVNVIQPNRSLGDNSKHSLFNKQTSIAISGHTLRQIHNASADEALYCLSVSLIYNLVKPGEVYDNMLLSTGGFQKIKEADPDMSIPKQLMLIGVKEISDHALPSIRYMLKANEPKSCAATPIHKITLTVERYYDKMIPLIFKVGGQAYIERYDNTVSPNIKRITLREILDKVVTPIFKIYGHMFPQIYKLTSGKVRDDEKVPSDNVSKLGHSSNTMLTVDGKYHTEHEVKEAANDTMIDEYDDDSPFGILSVYCNSEIHSSCGKMLEAER